MAENAKVEPWLRGTHTDVAPAQRAVLHALELAREDIHRWCFALSPDALERKPRALPSVGFQLRHIARSLDRLMTYAEGGALSEAQLAALRSEHEATGDMQAEFDGAMEQAIARLLRFDPLQLHEPRGVGRELLPTTVAGLLIHIADHTQRHVGQAITTAKVVAAMRDLQSS